MNQETVKKLIENGILPTQDILKKIEKYGIESVLKKDKKMSIEKRAINTLEKLTPKDFFHYYTNKYEGIKSLLLKKMSAISINQAKNSFLPVSVIGMVQEKTPSGFILEDPTGRIEVISQEDSIKPDDVLGVTGPVREQKLFAEKIIWPDIPLTHKTKNIPITITLSLEKNKNTIVPDTNPFWCDIWYENEKITLLAYRPENEIERQDAFELLKKRHLSPERNQIIFIEDHFLIEPVPDVFWIIAQKEWNAIYKGVTVVSGEKVKINLENMEIIKI